MELKESQAHTQVDAPLVSFEGVSKRFGNVEALKRIDLEVLPGEFIAVIGPSGCGKTTLLRLLAGLEEPSSGRMTLAGTDLATVAAAKRRTPMVWQNYALFPFMTVRQNVEFALKAIKTPTGELSSRVDEYLRKLGIEHLAENEIATISGGQKQRVALARALVQEPEILLLDEPLSALDAHLRVRMQTELKQMHLQSGITFFYVTHYQSEALSMADRIVVMNAGEIIQIGAPREIYRKPRTRFVAEFMGANNVMKAQVVDKRADQLTLSLFGVQVSVQNSLGSLIEAGDIVDVAVSADRIHPVADRHASAGVRLAGKLQGTNFSGSTITYFIEMTDGTVLRAELLAAQLTEGLEVLGSDLEIYWDPKDMVLLESEG